MSSAVILIQCFMRTNLSIALVDDDADSHLFLTRTIQRIHPSHMVASFYEGQALMRHLTENIEEKSLPDLIILDLTMPQMDGYDVLKELRSLPQLKNIKVFVLTASEQEYDRVKSIAYGCTNYYPKPLEPEKLEEIIYDMIKQMDEPSFETTVLKGEQNNHVL
jgi:CheY-like chemotaxis protein